MKYHFLSGLPRAGTSLMAALLHQNPAVYSNIMSPTGQIFIELRRSVSAANEAAIYLSNKQKRSIMTGLFDNYYDGISADIVVDNNRRWTACWSTLAGIFPEAKMICCVRPLAWVVDSVERAIRANPTELSAIFNFLPNTTVYQRANLLMQPEALVGYAYNGLRDAYYGPDRGRMLIMEYDYLVSEPAKAMETVGNFLDLPAFDYNFDAVEQFPNVDDFDLRLGTPGLHRLGNKVEQHKNPTSILPPDVFNSFPAPFWR